MQIAVHMVKYADEFIGILDKFLEQKALMRHQKKRCRGEENDFKCGQCDKEYFHEERLLEHLAANLQSQLIEKLLVSGTNLIGELSQN